MINKGIWWKLPTAVALGIVFGYKFLPSAIVGGVFLYLLIQCFVAAMNNNMYKLFMYLPFCVYGETIIRTTVKWLPYLSMQYLYLAAFGIMLLKNVKTKAAHAPPYAFMLSFGLLEIVNGLNPDKAVLLRSIFFNSFSLVICIVWASFNSLSPTVINRSIASIKYAGCFLGGYILVAHLTGRINYGTFSNTAASNGLAPVQMSGYLGFVASMFFISLMSPHERKNTVMNATAFIFITTIMVLTLSRGGLYFIGVVAAMFLFFNRARLGNYFKYLMLIPVAIIVFNFVVDTTQGKVKERYEEEGSSNRDVLVKIGFEIFKKHPILGVGTSNYATTIFKEKYFEQESGAHNEFVRAAAEHGIVGIFLYWGFFVAMFIHIFKRREPARQFSIYFLTLFCLITVHNGLKIGVQQLLAILAIANPGTVTAYTKSVKNVISRPRSLSKPASTP